VDLFIYFPIRLRGVVLKQLSTGETLHLPGRVFAQCVLDSVAEISDVNFSPFSERPDSRINNNFKIHIA
jgi:hypothetical protein